MKQMKQSIKSYKTYSSILFTLLIILIILPIILIHELNPGTLRYVVMQFIVFTTFIFWVLKSSCQEKSFFKNNLINKLVLVFVGVIAISIFFSPYPFFSIESFFLYLSYIVLFLLVSHAVQSIKQINTIIYCVIGAVVFVCLYALLQRNGVQWVAHFLSYNGRVSSIFGNPDFFAAFLIMVLPLILYLYFRPVKYASIVVIAVLFLFLFTSLNLFCTFSRAAFIACALSFAIFFFLNFKSIFQQKKKLVFLALFSLLFVFAVLTSADQYCSYKENLLIESVEQRISESISKSYFFDSTASLTGHEEETKTFFLDYVRRTFYSASFEMAKDHPLFGTGIGMFGFVIPDYFNHLAVPELLPPSMENKIVIYSDYYNPRGVHVHNEYLQLLAETGIFGLGIFLALLCVFFISVFSYLHKTKNLANSVNLANSSKSDVTDIINVKDSRMLLVAILSGIVGILVMNIFSVSLRFPSITYLFWGLLGLGVAVMNLKKEKKEKDNLPTYSSAWKNVFISAKKSRLFLLLVVLSVFLLLFLFFVSFSLLKSDILLSQSQDNIKDNNYTKDDNGLNKAIIYNPLNYQAYLGLVSEGYRLSDYPLIINSLNRLNLVMPNHFLVNYHLGRAYFELGRYEDALVYFSLLKPDTIRTYWMGKSYYALGKQDESLSFFSKALGSGVDPSSVFTPIAEIKFMKGFAQEAEVLLKSVLQKERANSRAGYDLGMIYYSQKKYENATEMFINVINFFPQYHLLDSEQKEILSHIILLYNETAISEKYYAYKTFFEKESEIALSLNTTPEKLIFDYHITG